MAASSNDTPINDGRARDLATGALLAGQRNVVLVGGYSIQALVAQKAIKRLNRRIVGGFARGWIDARRNEVGLRRMIKPALFSARYDCGRSSSPALALPSLLGASPKCVAEGRHSG